MTTVPRIVIVGAGFSGLLAAKKISQRLGTTADIVLINKGDAFLFAPRLIDALEDHTDHLPFQADLKHLSAKYGYRFVQATVDLVDRAAKVVHCTYPNGKTEELSYDIIVLSPGATTNYYNTPGAKEFAIDLKTYANVEQIRGRIAQLFDRAAAAKDDAGRRRILAFAVVGGGASGVEAMFALKIHVERYANAQAPQLKKFLSFILVQSAPQLLMGFPDSIVDGAIMQIHRQGVSLFLGEPVTKITKDGFETMHSRKVPAGLVLWCAGLAPQPLTISPEPAKEPTGYVLTDRALKIDATTFAAGDAITFRDRLVVVPKNGQTARLMAFVIAENVVRTLRKQPLKHFHYFSKGSIIVVGKMGFLDMRLFVIKSPLIIWFRDILYRLLYTEIAT